MKPLNVSLVSLGSLKYPINIDFIEKWASEILAVKHRATVNHLPDSEGQFWEYSGRQLRSLVQADNDADFTVALINAPLEDNYYMRRLDDDVVVISLYEMADIVQSSNFTIEHYILRNIYELAVLYVGNNERIPPSGYTWAHDDVRGCLFDMNSTKSDIVFSMHRPRLCDACRHRLSSVQIDSQFLPTLDKELRRIEKTLYFRMIEWVKAKPKCALALTAVSAVILNLVASLIFEWGLGRLPASKTATEARENAKREGVAPSH
ncbi:MAG: hypothetical protein WC740_09435 [Verrucomicrobiia bacterium]